VGIKILFERGNRSTFKDMSGKIVSQEQKGRVGDIAKVHINTEKVRVIYVVFPQTKSIIGLCFIAMQTYKELLKF
jgi:hypothetical protein